MLCSTHIRANIMKKFLFITVAVLACSYIQLNAQNVEVGDTVMVNPSTERYLTGERISRWVYDVPHTISQVGTTNFPEGVLLNIAGARSWLDKDDITIVNPKNHTNIIVHDTILIPAQKEIVYLHDTIFQDNTINTIVKTDTIYIKEEGIHPEEKQTHFQLNANVLGLVGKYNAGFGLEGIFGARLNDYAFVGAGVEVESLWMDWNKKAINGIQVAIFANTKVYLPIQNTYYPFMEMSAGLNMGNVEALNGTQKREEDLYFGLHARAGLGIDIKSFSLGIGYQFGGGCSKIESDLHHAYLRIGYRFLDR